MSQNNLGRLFRGVTTAGLAVTVTVGDTNPEFDNLPQPARVGDRRYRVGNPTLVTGFESFWVCITAGTPGFWSLIRIPNMQLLWEHNYRFNGVNPLVADAYTNDVWSLVDQDAWLAYTGPDVRVIGESGGFTRNGQPVPVGFANASTEPVDLLAVHACIDVNTFAPSANALQFTVVNQAGVNVAVCTPVADGVLGYVEMFYGIPAAPIIPGNTLSLKLHTSLAAGVGGLNVAVKVSGYRNTFAG